MRPPRRQLLPAVLALVGLWAIALAAPGVCETGPRSGKAGYHLFRPTPAPLLRDLSTDRPDVTESPYTVDAGHFQVEVEVLSYSRDETASQRLEGVGLVDINAKAGLLSNVDLQIGAGAARHSSASAGPTPGPEETVSGITDLAVRLKWNLWGNDAGGTAMALMPFVKLPTGTRELSNGAVEGGIIAPFAVSLPGAVDLGLMVEADWLEDADGADRHAEWLTTATVGRDVAGPLGAYVEFASGLRPRAEGDWVGTLDAGLTYGPTANLQLDAGVLLGISEDADGVTFFTGLSLRR